METINKFLDLVVYILKYIVYFDTISIQYGGGERNNSNNSNSDNSEKSEKNPEDLNKDGLGASSEMVKEMWDETVRIIMSVLKWMFSKVMILASMLLFASTAPIIPFFIAMGGMFGVVKYFMFKLRRL